MSKPMGCVFTVLACVVLWLLIGLALPAHCDDRPNRYGYPSPARRHANAQILVLGAHSDILILPAGPNPRRLYLPSTDHMREIRRLEFDVLYVEPYHPRRRQVFETDFQTYRRADE